MCVLERLQLRYWPSLVQLGTVWYSLVQLGTVCFKMVAGTEVVYHGTFLRQLRALFIELLFELSELSIKQLEP